MNRLLLFFSLPLLFTACVQDRDLHLENDFSFSDLKGDLVLNEIAPMGTAISNEFGEQADWFELYNATELPIELLPNRYFFTDDLEEPQKFTLSRTITIAPGNYALFWCDKYEQVEEHIHTNFKLSGNGEDLAIFVLEDNGELNILDHISFPEMEANKSYGRTADGMNTWMVFDVPTPNQAN